MSAIEVHQIVNGPITCHAFNRDKTELALCPNTNEVLIFKKNDEGTWVQTAVLNQHDKLVTGIDWDPVYNRIVTCSQDRNAYVWTWRSDPVSPEKGEFWNPALVLLRINRSATHVKWSPLGNKFAVGSGAKCICVCYLDPGLGVWLCRMIRKPIKSSVLAIDWHPNNVIIASASVDFKARVFSAYISFLDEKPGPTSWGSKLPFGILLGEFTAGGWVHDTSFSPSGDQIAYVSHDSTLCIQSGPESAQVSATLKTPYLPFTHVKWLSPNTLVAAGHDNNPVLFEFDGLNLKFIREGIAGEKRSDPAAGKKSNIFVEMDSKGQVGGDTLLTTQHQKAINGIQAFGGTGMSVSKFSTVADDGNLVIWDMSTLI